MHKNALLTPILTILLFVAPTAARCVEISHIEYEGRSHFLVKTRQATWYYDRAGGGFSRLIDRDGRDWIAFRKDPLSEYPASAAAGYRGIPNAVFVGPDKGAGHPGFDKCESTMLSQNEIRTTSRSGKWQWTWTFREHDATFSMDRADETGKWWFLYEGPIAGSFAPQRKLWGTDLGGPRHDVPDSKSQLFDKWRWVYFADRELPRVLFVAQHAADELPDTLWYLGSSEGGSASAEDGMVVFGFGRGPGATPLFQGSGQRLTVGLLDENVRDASDHARIANRIRAIMQER